MDGSTLIDHPATSERSTRADAWSNSMTGMGSSLRDKRLSTEYYADPVTAEEGIEMQRGDDLAARIVETLPHEMLREGYTLSVKDDDDGGDRTALITDAWDVLGLDAAFEEALKYERGGGGGAVFIGANDGQADLTQPLNIDACTSLDWLTALEATELTPVRWYTNPNAPKFGKVAVYRLNPLKLGSPVEKDLEAFKPSLVDVHESRFVIFPGIRVSRRQQSATMAGWGDSVLTRCRSVLRDFNMSWSAAAILLHDFAQAVFSMEGLAELMLADDGAALLRARMATMDMSRSTARAIVIDSKEKFERQSSPVTGLPELLDRFSTRLAAAADMPLTLLMGQSPGGLNATGASDIRFFYDRVASMQKRKLLPAIRYITRILFNVYGGAPKKWSIAFNPLWQPTEAEQATARKTQADTDAIYIDRQVITPEDVAHSRFSGADYQFATEIDFGGRDALDEVRAGDPEAEGLRAPSGKAVAVDVQKAAFNGAQVLAMIDIAKAVALGDIERVTGIEILFAAFPVDRETAARMLPVGFKTEKPVPPAPFGGDKPPAFGEKPDAEKPSDPAKPDAKPAVGESPIEAAPDSTPVKGEDA